MNDNSVAINSTIYGGKGNDLITNDASNDLVVSRDGNDVIPNRGDNVTIDAGDDNDEIRNSGSNVTINGGEGDDKISSYGSYVLTAGGDGDDTISTGGIPKSFYDTIIGGKGDDAIYNGTWHDKDIYFYNVGDGNDTIHYFGANDTLMIANSDYTTIKDGSLVIVQVGEGSVILTGLGDNSPKIKTTSKNITVPSFDNITIPNFDNITIPTNSSNESVDSKPSETVSPIEKPSSTTTTAGGSNDTPSSTDNTPIIINNYYGDYYDMSENNGTIVINSSIGGDVTNNTNIDNSTTIIKYGNTYNYNGGNKNINNYQSGEILSFDANYTGWTTNGNELVINAAEGSVRIADAKDKLVELADANGNLLAHVFLAGNYEGAIDGRGFDKFEVIVGADNVSNQIYACEIGSSLWGGNGNSNDELYGNSGFDEFVYRYGNGQDNIFNANAEDAVNLNGVNLEQISDAHILDGGVNLKFTDGGALNISGQVGSFILSGQKFGANYQSKTWYAK